MASTTIGPARKTTAKDVASKIWHHVVRHTGVGIVCAVAYFDPGNWGVDLQAGAEFGYRLLFVVLLAGIFAVFLQVLASRLGCVTGVDLASHCRLLLHSRPKHKLLWRWLGLYLLYLLAEIAIIATDLAELLGSAIALCLLFPRLELWHGVLITAFDVVFLLAMKDPLGGRPVRSFEILIGFLVLAVLVCMCIIIARADVHWGHAFQGYLPSKYIVQNGGLYVSVGILGATVMPHSLFLGSALATQDRLSQKQPANDGNVSSTPTLSSSSSVPSEETLPTFSPPPKTASVTRFIPSFLAASFRRPPPSSYSTEAKTHAERENRPLGIVNAHILHGTIDILVSLLGFAVVINSLILILAASVSREEGRESPASLFDAYDTIRDLVGQAAATLFAVALLAAGQSSSIIATLAGQAVSEGFLRWRVSPVLRRLLTRLIAIIPSMAVAIAVGRDGIDSLLVASQVVLAVVLPFVSIPLMWCTSQKAIMLSRDESGKTADFSNNWLVIGFGVAILLIVGVANLYVLVELGRGVS